MRSKTSSFRFSRGPLLRVSINKTKKRSPSEKVSIIYQVVVDDSYAINNVQCDSNDIHLHNSIAARPRGIISRTSTTVVPRVCWW